MAEPHATEPSDSSVLADPPGEDSPAGELERSRAELDAQRAESERYLSLLQRAQADYLNYKRRAEAEREGVGVAARAEAILTFLPVVDDLERALTHLPVAVRGESWAQGFLLIERNLAALFGRLGLQRIGAPGDEFDPRVHEAVAYEESSAQPEGHVTTVMRPGYMLGERVVRPAQVAVARAPVTAHESTWPHHPGSAVHSNGGVERSDLNGPRGIDRTS